MYYIAYGSNLNFKLMKSRCPRAKPIFYLNGFRVNKLFGWKLVFNRYANIIKDNKTFVPIGLWKITKHCEIELDVYEDFPKLYRKYYFSYYGKKVMTYTMVKKTSFKFPTERYLNIVKRGYKDCNLDKKILYKALQEK